MISLQIKITRDEPITTNQCSSIMKLMLYQTSRKPSVLTDRNAVGPTISKYISDRMSGKT